MEGLQSFMFSGVLSIAGHALMQASAAPSSALASQLATSGVAVVEQPQLDAAVLEQAAARSSARLDSLLSQVQEAGAEPIEQHYTFSELSH